MFPGRKYVPKTLVFSKDASHAEDITTAIAGHLKARNSLARQMHRLLCKENQQHQQQNLAPLAPHMTVPSTEAGLTQTEIAKIPAKKF